MRLGRGVIKLKALLLLSDKAWKAGMGTKKTYCWVMRIVRREVHHALQDADKVVFENIGPKSSEVFLLTNQMRRKNADLIGYKPVRNDTRSCL